MMKNGFVMMNSQKIQTFLEILIILYQLS